MTALVSARDRDPWSGEEAVGLTRMATVMMGDIGEEITEIELEPLPEEVPAGVPGQPVTEPVPS